MKPCLFWDRYGYYYGTLGGPQSWNAVVFFFSMVDPPGNHGTQTDSQTARWLHPTYQLVNFTKETFLKIGGETMCETTMFWKSSKTCWGKVEVWPLYQSLSFRDFWGLWRIKICSNGCKIARNHVLSAWFMVPMPGGPLGLNLSNRCSRNFPVTKPISEPTSIQPSLGVCGRHHKKNNEPHDAPGVQQVEQRHLQRKPCAAPGRDWKMIPKYICRDLPKLLTHGRLIKMFLFQSEKWIYMHGGLFLRKNDSRCMVDFSYV